jgi:transcriptional regulator GlxA family with amidase domain
LVYIPFSGHPEMAPQAGRPDVRSRAAWEDRARLLSLGARAGPARSLVALARAHTREAYPVGLAAAVLGTSVRGLTRLSMKALGYSPGIVLRLARIAGVARTLESTSRRLETVAQAHGFTDPAAMSRLFYRFVGVRPGAYRRLFRGGGPG